MNGASGDDPETGFSGRTNAGAKSVFYNKDVVCYTEKEDPATEHRQNRDEPTK